MQIIRSNLLNCTENVANVLVNRIFFVPLQTKIV